MLQKMFRLCILLIVHALATWIILSLDIPESNYHLLNLIYACIILPTKNSCTINPLDSKVTWYIKKKKGRKEKQFKIVCVAEK